MSLLTGRIGFAIRVMLYCLDIAVASKWTLNPFRVHVCLCWSKGKAGQAEKEYVDRLFKPKSTHLRITFCPCCCAMIGFWQTYRSCAELAISPEAPSTTSRS